MDKNIADISIVVLNDKHLSQAEKWPSRHSAANTLLKTSVEPGIHQPENYGWAALEGEEVLAIVTLRLNPEHIGYINCIVKPGNKRQGIGTMIFEHAMGQPEVKKLIHLHAAIDPANTAARQVLTEQGFTLIGNDSNGYLEFAKHTHY